MQDEVIVYRSLIFPLKEWKSSEYLGRPLTNQNSIHEEIKSRLKSGNACYHSVQNLLSSSWLTKHLKIKIYRTLIFPVVFMGVKLGRLH